MSQDRSLSAVAALFGPGAAGVSAKQTGLRRCPRRQGVIVESENAAGAAVRQVAFFGRAAVSSIEIQQDLLKKRPARSSSPRHSDDARFCAQSLAADAPVKRERSMVASARCAAAAVLRSIGLYQQSPNQLLGYRCVVVEETSRRESVCRDVRA